jgi:hypothetical protein
VVITSREDNCKLILLIVKDLTGLGSVVFVFHIKILVSWLWVLLYYYFNTVTI